MPRYDLRERRVTSLHSQAAAAQLILATDEPNLSSLELSLYARGLHLRDPSKCVYRRGATPELSRSARAQAIARGVTGEPPDERLQVQSSRAIAAFSDSRDARFAMMLWRAVTVEQCAPHRHGCSP